MTSTILVIGAGQSGSQAVDTLRREGYNGRLVLVGEESELPYQRPPLSKKFLSGELEKERLYFRLRSFYDEHQIELKLGVQVTRIDPVGREASISDGEQIHYDRALICVGAIARRLSCAGAELAGVHYLRRISDISSIQKDMKPGARAVIIGGGYIGLEAAATAQKKGCSVTVLELADRAL